MGLGDLTGGSFISFASGVSDDGSVVVGRGFSASGQEASRWTSGGGMVGLGDLAGLQVGSQAWGVSGDGQRIVGSGTTADGTRAFLWDQSNGMRNLQTVLSTDYGLGTA